MKKDRKQVPVPLLFAGALMVMLFYVWQHIRVVNLGYRINELKNEIASLEDENYILGKNIMKYTSLEEIDRTARTKLGMVTPRQKDIVFLDTGEKD